jgi:copper ion binding protein
MATRQFRVPGISCDHCVKAITGELSNLEGIKRVHVSIPDHKVIVEHTDQLTNDAIIAAINEAGFDEVETVG